MTEEFCKVTDDEETSCQSNCKQPGPKDKDGNVQKRIIGYYEAWNYKKSCAGMGFSDIPVNALTHAYFSFGYITPGDFKIAPMDDLPTDLFSEFTAIKKRNSGLKAVVALGGWTFNDNGTATQPVFSNMVSTAANRKTFIGNLFGFMRKYGFDGVDFDWEYPGAGDRGGKPDDGKNFVTFLKELDEQNNKQPEKYIVSFTIPTSYWYLRHFDLKAIDHVDFVNIMSYDLHGIWDSTNPIGSNIFAHSNLTEIKSALDLLWRNDVPAKKLNLGLGFYGRSFTLVDPLCTTPGCGFRGGANPGSCSNNAGTLTYREIQQIIKDKKLKPHHDKKAAVKWINWDQDQWVSYVSILSVTMPLLSCFSFFPLFPQVIYTISKTICFKHIMCTFDLETLNSSFYMCLYLLCANPRRTTQIRSNKKSISPMMSDCQVSSSGP